MNVDIFGYFAAILTTAAFLPQLIKTLKTKKADDVSSENGDQEKDTGEEALSDSEKKKDSNN